MRPRGDPVERASSKVVGVAAYRSQPSIDPQRMQEWVPGVIWGAPALGVSFEESLKRREELLPLIRKWSPDWLLNKDAAPIYFENEWGMTQPADITEATTKCIHRMGNGLPEAGPIRGSHRLQQVSRSPDGEVQGHLGFHRAEPDGAGEVEPQPWFAGQRTMSATKLAARLVKNCHPSASSG